MGMTADPKRYEVEWTEGGRHLCKHFADLENAEAFRDFLPPYTSPILRDLSTQ